MRKQSLKNQSKIGMVIALTFLVSLSLVGQTLLGMVVKAGGQETVPCTAGTVVAKSGNSAQGTTDPKVFFSTDNGGTFTQQAFVVPPLVDPTFFYDTILNTEYVAINPDRSAPATNLPPPGNSIPQFFQTKFQVPEGCNSPTLTVAINADNVATVSLNGVQFGMQVDLETKDNFQSPPDLFTTTGPFLPGDNTLTFRVGNYTNQLALDFEARICCAEVPSCRTCNEAVVVVDQNVTVNLNPAIPVCTGDPDLCAFMTFDKSGPTPATWKAIFNLGASKLLVKDGATITVTPGPPNGGNNKESPGIVIRTTCDVEVEAGGVIAVQSINQKAGDILIQADGNVLINGTVSNSVIGTNGRPGKVTIASCCGGITTGPSSLIETVGVDHGGNDINLLTCGGSGGGDIVINGLVDASYKAAIAPTINIASFAGAVTIDGNNFQGIEAGTKRRITSGVTVRSNRDPLAGTIKIQANNDITVRGNAILAKLYPNYGAVAVKPTSTNGTSGDGGIFATSVNGRIIATDRAFDIANRFNNLKNDITLLAAGNIDLSVTAIKDDGAATNAKPVVNSQGGSAGKGGINTIRSHSGGINIGANAQVLANFVGTPGSDGTNLLTSCTGIVNNGVVAPPNSAPPGPVCVPPAPSPLFGSCENFSVCGVRGNGN